MIGKPDYASEFYVIVRTVEVVTSKGTFRIEVLEEFGAQQKFSTRAYERDDIVAQPTYPQTHGKYDRKPQSFEIWKSIDIGWTSRDTADGALSQALGFLGERFRT